MQTFGTSELGGKLLAEGKNLEADLITMSTFYIDSAQEQNQMFKDLAFPVNPTEEFPSYCAPVTAQEGALIINTKVMESSGLPDVYKRQVLRSVLQNLLNMGKNHLESHATAVLMKNKNV